jgi:hypothetical protein
MSGDELGFLLERSDGNNNNFQQIKFLNANTSSYADPAVTGNMVYYYRVRATNTAGNSAYSNIITVQPKYCVVSKAVSNPYAMISKVQLGDINNTTTNCTNRSYDYLDQRTELFAGKLYG